MGGHFQTFLLVIWASTIVFQAGIITAAVHPLNQNYSNDVQELRHLLNGKIYPNYSMLHGYIKDELYLSRWLHHNNYNVKQAYNSVMAHLRWRDSEKVDKIHLEDWSRFMEEYPQFVGSTDKLGRPVSELWYSEWNVRSAAVTGQLGRLARWLLWLSEMTQRKLYAQRRLAGNRNVTGAVEIVDMEGYSRSKHGCVLCMPLLMQIGHTVKVNYPQLWEENYMVSAGPLFRQVFSSIKVSFDYGRNDTIKMYSSKREWLPILDKRIDKSQRSVRFGGSIKRI